MNLMEARRILQTLSCTLRPRYLDLWTHPQSHTAVTGQFFQLSAFSRTSGSSRRMADVRQEPFPANTRSASGLVNGIATEATSTQFSDKILVTICQKGRLSQWIQVPLMGSAAGTVEMDLPSTSQGLLPSTHLTAKTLLGGGGDERETLGQLYASQVASHLSLRSPEDRRVLVLGLGLMKVDTEREGFFDLIELAMKVL